MYCNPPVSEVETKELRDLRNALTNAKEALARKGGSVQNPIANSFLLEAEAKINKLLKLDRPVYPAED